MFWIIQNKVFGTEDEPTLKSFKNYEFVENECEIQNVMRKHPEEKFFFRGSVEFVTKYTKMYGNKKDFNLEAFDTRNYYPYLNVSLLNFNHSVIIYNNIIKEYPFIKCRFHNPEKYFIRPCSGDKIFTGTYITDRNLKHDLRIIQEVNKADLSEVLTMVCPYVDNIVSEYRVAMFNQKAIGCALYEGEEGDIDRIRTIAENVAKLKLKDYKVLPQMYTIDIALMTNRRYKVIEVNSFNAAGLYGMELDYKL